MKLIVAFLQFLQTCLKILFKGQTDDFNLMTVAVMWQKLPSLNCMVSSLNITPPTNALIVCHLF